MRTSLRIGSPVPWAITLMSTFLLGAAWGLAAEPAQLSTDADTLLYVKTTPSGAEIHLDGQKKGLSGELLTVTPGTYKLVIELAGYEAKEQQITITSGRVTRIEVTLVKAAGGSAAAHSLLKYDDDKADGKRSFGGSGEMIKYSLPPGQWRVKAIQLHGSRYGLPQPPAENFMIYFLDQSMQEVATEDAPYRLFRRGEEKWVRIPFKEPVEVPKDFWICANFNAHQTKGVYVSYDTSTGGKHSKVGLPGEDAKDVDFGGDWMIRVELVSADQAGLTSTANARAKPSAARNTLKHDDNRADGKRSFGGSGEMVRFSLPEGNWKVKGIQLHGSRYGLPSPPAEDFQVYFLSDDLSKTVATRGAPYRLFNRGSQRWVRIPFAELVEVPKDFWVCVNFNAQATKGVYVSYDTSSGGKFSKIGLPEGEKKDVDFGGDWMIRVDLVSADAPGGQTPSTSR
jgi:hypothetical protein